MPNPLTRPLPEPPRALRRGPLRSGAFPSRLHDPVVTARVGRWLGVAFATCFVTGLISHYLQAPPSWLPIPQRPVWGYRLSQGIHVATGIASVPLLLVKLWTVSPRLWAWPPVRSVAHAIERLTVLLLVASAVFELATGLVNVAQWYPWSFYFPRVHYYVGWVAIGSILLHVGVKLPVIAAALGRPVEVEPKPGSAGPDGEGGHGDGGGDHGGGDHGGGDHGGLSRRGLLVGTGAAVAAVTVGTVGQTLAPLRRLTLLAPRRPDIGPQRLPINRTAAEAGVRGTAARSDYRLTVAGPRTVTLSLAELRALPQYEAVLPIACVEGWSASGRWRGVRVRDLLDRVGAPAGVTARVDSMEKSGIYTSSVLRPAETRDELALLALELNGRPLDVDHGYPLRLIAPNRPGVLQTKWVRKLEVL